MTDFSPLAECRYTVIGDPVAHSKSPAMQNAGFAALGLGTPYGKLRIPAEDLPEFARYARRNLDGANLTVPHKNRILPELDGMSDMARLCGSVNTLLVRDGKLFGDTTDGYGFTQAIQEAFQLKPEGLETVFFGAGGAVRAVVFYLAGRGASAVRLVNRTPERAENLAGDLKKAFPALTVEYTVPGNRKKVREFLESSSLAVQATSQGLKPDDAPPFDLALLEGLRQTVCFDMIYHATPFQREAARCGLPPSGGSGMLLHQGARSLELWTGRPAPVEVMRRALDEA